MTSTLSLRDRCIALAQEQALEINGDLIYVDPSDLETCLSGLTDETLQETASDLAHLAALCS
jgi:hypothetical protein